jgi:hypothetical protein
MDIFWLAVGGMTPREVASALGFADEGSCRQAGGVWLTSPKGMGVVRLPGSEHVRLQPERLEELCQEHPVWVGSFEPEALSACLLEGRDGEVVWSLSHDGLLGADHLEFEGKMPRPWAALQKAAQEQARQDGEPVEGYSLVSQLARELLGVDPAEA